MAQDLKQEDRIKAGRPPWATLGGSVSKGASVDSMLKKHGLDWEVSVNPLTYQLGKDLRTLKSHRVMMRSDTMDPLGICGPQYVPIQNKVAFDFFKMFCDSGGMEISAVGCFGRGTMPWALADIGEAFSLPGNDEVGGHILLFNPHIWGKSFIVKFTTIRVVCMNTLVAALAEDTGVKNVKFLHIKDFDEKAMKGAKDVLESSISQLKSFESSARLLSGTPIDDRQAVKLMAWTFDEPVLKEAMGSDYGNKDKVARFLAKDKKFSPTAMDFTKRGASQAITLAGQSPGAELESAQGTFWGLFNGLTYYVDHASGSSRDKALQEAWLGTKSSLKSKALERAVAFAKAL